ncbi:MAG: transposase [Chitinophagaceae bacterium]
MPPLPNTDLFEAENFYHVFNHAVGSELLYRNENNYLYFLRKLKEYITPVCNIYAYCLMPNHFHILIKIKTEKELMEFCNSLKRENKIETYDFHKIAMNQFKHMLNGYAQAYNKMYIRKGALFIDYLRRKQITDNHYFTKIIHYIHNNPIHHNFCKSIDEWTYSSYHTILSNKPTGVEREKVIDWFGSLNNFKALHQQSVDILNEIEL